MQLTVELKKKDVEAFVAFHNSRLPQVVEERRRQQKERLCFTVVNLVLTSVGSAIPSLIHGNWHSFWLGALIGAGVGEAHSFFKRRIRQGKQQVPGIAEYVKSSTGGWQIKVDSSGVVVRRGGNAWRYHRDKVGRVVTVPGYTFVYLSDDWAFTIPHYAVSPADYKAFMQALAALFNTPFNVPPLTFTPLEEARQTIGVRPH